MALARAAAWSEETKLPVSRRSDREHRGRGCSVRHRAVLDRIEGHREAVTDHGPLRRRESLQRLDDGPLVSAWADDELRLSRERREADPEIRRDLVEESDRAASSAAARRLGTISVCSIDCDTSITRTITGEASSTLRRKPVKAKTRHPTASSSGTIGRTFRHLERRWRMTFAGRRPRTGAGLRPATYATTMSATTPRAMSRTGDISRHRISPAAPSAVLEAMRRPGHPRALPIATSRRARP